MYKVFIWGTGDWGEKCFLDILPDVDIIGFVESKVSRKWFHGKQVIAGQELAGYEYDYVIMANTHEDAIGREFHIDPSKTVYYRQIPRPDGARLFTYQIADQARGLMPYLSVECDGLKFLYNRTDSLMPNAMTFYKSTWSKAEMEFFWRAAPRRDTGIFMDIGANIGTTSIYFKKKLAKDLSYIAFEPVKENIKVLKTNCILNDCEDIVVENLGISDSEGVMGLTVVEANYGGSRVTDKEENQDFCQTMQLDTYVRKNNISPQEVSYIWMDIEGHEANAVAGARALLSQSNASLFMEYNAGEYRAGGKLAAVLDDLSSIYHSFICYEQYTAGITQRRSIRELENLADEMDWRQCNVLFIK